MEGSTSAPTIEEAVHDADIVVVATPIPAIAATVAQALAAAPRAVVTDVGSVKKPLVAAVGALAASADLARYVPGHPMGGSERSGPDHASASVVDGIVWVVTPTAASDAGAVDGSKAGSHGSAPGPCGWTPFATTASSRSSATFRRSPRRR